MVKCSENCAHYGWAMEDGDEDLNGFCHAKCWRELVGFVDDIANGREECLHPELKQETKD